MSASLICRMLEEKLPRSISMVLVCFAIYAAFCLPGYAHKYLNNHYSINAPVFLTFTQFFTVTLLCSPSLYRATFSKKKLSVKFVIYFLTSTALLVSMALDNYCVLRLNYSTELLFKSPKVLTVMVGNIVFLKKAFSVSEILSTSLVVCGFVGMALGDFSGKNNFDLNGIAAVVVSLTLEAIASNMEEYILKLCNATIEESMSLIFTIGTGLTLSWSICTGEFLNACIKIRENPASLFYLAIYSILGAIGLFVVFISLKIFGSLQTVMFTSIRKVINSCVAFFIFHDRIISFWHITSLFLVASGFALNISDISKNEKKEGHRPSLEGSQNYDVLVEGGEEDPSGNSGLFDV
ncbi:Slc35b3 protein [Tritrichomonas foetus]|uniref:Slc35b3 protein n=1 Tax=Tritrichomonas foetus TaxID=1144522 RepID=A0A1J4K9V6_9EUKA|nr:Slc35b3 protein [Tritrichomonas foetus]|eukprot:OHT08249.1 Slc35b3 protein [Tritrichomonas foetus]